MPFKLRKTKSFILQSIAKKQQFCGLHQHAAFGFLTFTAKQNGNKRFFGCSSFFVNDYFCAPQWLFALSISN